MNLDRPLILCYILRRRRNEMDTMTKWPPIGYGTWVKTTQPNQEKRKKWTDEGWAKRKWGVRGTIVAHHDSHGLCYDVLHKDGTTACYDPTEFEVVL
jgi:hypothetical protein